MRVTVLMENCTPSSRFAARHGLSLLLEVAPSAAGPAAAVPSLVPLAPVQPAMTAPAPAPAAPRRVLFDMGPDDAFLDNARTLGVSVADVDCAVLSHGHYDHGGGLPAFLAASATAPHPAPVYVRAGAFAEHASGTPAIHHAIGIDPALAAHPRITALGEGPAAIAPGLTLFTTPRRNYPAATSNKRLLERRDGTWAPDAFAHEQSLLVEENNRHILVAGCAHAGILNIMDEAECLAGAPLDAVVAGFHLMSPSAGQAQAAEATRALARELAARPATRYYTFHCTGLEAFGYLRDELGGRVRYLAAGSQAEV